MEIWKTAARADGKAIHNLMEKDKPFPTGLQTAFPQPRKDTTISPLHKQPCDFCTPKHFRKDSYKKRNGREKEQPYYGKSRISRRDIIYHS